MKVWLENDLNCKLRQAEALDKSILYISSNVRVQRVRTINNELFITTDVPAERRGAWIVEEDPR